jgi:hypothetical protein
MERREYAVLTYLMDHPNQIHTRDTIAGACGLQTGASRTVDTIVAQIRRCLGQRRDNIVCAGRKSGYAWLGDRVSLVPVVWTQSAPRRNDPLARFAVMTQRDVAKRLGLSPQEISAIEISAIGKLRKNPAIKEAWQAMLATRNRYHYDPFYECWLFAVQEEVANPYVEAESEE